MIEPLEKTYDRLRFLEYSWALISSTLAASPEVVELKKQMEKEMLSLIKSKMEMKE